MKRTSQVSVVRRVLLAANLAGGVFACVALFAQGTNGVSISYSATTANVVTPENIRIDLLRWSSDAEKSHLLKAWTNPESVGAKGKEAADVTDPFGSFGKNRAPAEDDPAAAPEPAAAKGKGPAAAKGGGRGNSTPRKAPEAALAEALQTAPTVGYLWTSEVAGYSLRYAAKMAQPDGGERLVLVTDRRIGAYNDGWKPTSGTANDYAFSLLELRVPAKGEGEGKLSVTGKVMADSTANTLALENYASLPITLKAIKRQSK